MSGIAGIVRFDGASVDRMLAERMTESLAFRGPDASSVWVSGGVGLGHALFRTTGESEGEQQPARLGGLDDALWITADARVDGRSSLLDALRAGGRDCPRSATDPELILHAYALWGERAVERLLGDFSFAIWDSRERKLFCARDQFGVKPFFYAHLGHSLLFSNTLDSILIVPGVSRELDEQFIADFLLFESSLDPDRTAFQGVRRLPPAHVLVADAAKVATRPYWALPAESPTRFRQPSDYVERFRELFEEAVRDRLRTRRAAVLMSGGLDSTSVAAASKKILTQAGEPFELQAYTTVFDRLIEHRERHYASLAARELRIPVDYFPVDDYQLFQGWEDGAIRIPEPVNNPLVLPALEHLRRIAAENRVALSGYGGDPALSSRISRHCRELLRQWRLGRFALDLVRYLAAEKRYSRLYIRGRLQEWMSRGNGAETYPEWLNPDFEKRMDLRARWQQFARPVAPEGAVRPEAYELLRSPDWACIFEGYDTGATGAHLEVRHPFFDLRLLRYVLSLPALPWCADKEILRVAMKGLLPEAIRLRPKAPMSGNPFAARRADLAKVLGDGFAPAPDLVRFVRWSGLLDFSDENGLLRTLRPVSLNFWLKSQSRFMYKHATGGPP